MTLPLVGFPPPTLHVLNYVSADTIALIQESLTKLYAYYREKYPPAVEEEAAKRFTEASYAHFDDRLLLTDEQLDLLYSALSLVEFQTDFRGLRNRVFHGLRDDVRRLKGISVD